MFSLLKSTEDVIIHHSELPIPALAFGAIAMGVFIALAGVVWSYRNVANRHSHKAEAHSAHH